MTSHLRKIQYQLKHDYSSLKSDLRYSYFEAFLSSFIIGIAESFFAAFAIEKGLSVIQSGLLLSLPLIFAVLLNLVLNLKMKRMSVSQQVKRNVLLQTISLGGLMLFAVTPMINATYTFILLLGLFSIYWYGHFSSLPAWNLWISELLQVEKGTHYFTLRTRLLQVGVITGLLSGGALLHWKSSGLMSTHLFALLFTVALMGLGLKYISYQKHTHSHSVMTFSFTKFKKIFNGNRKFFMTYGLFNGSLFLSTPYVTGYLLIRRHVDYFDFMLITASLFAGKIAMTYMLNFKEIIPQPMKLMTIGALVAAPLPFFWPYCEINHMYLLNFISGLAWGLWEIGLSLIFFKNIPAHEKIETVTLYSTIGITTQMIGTAIGALCIKYVFEYDYVTVFAFAGLVRLIFALPFSKNKNLNINSDSQVSDYKKAS